MMEKCAGVKSMPAFSGEPCSRWLMYTPAAPFRARFAIIVIHFSVG